MPQFDYATYGELLRFGAAEAKAISWGTDTTKKAAQLVHHTALGHNEPLLQLADLLHEHDHPAAGIVQRAAEGQGIEGNGYTRDMLALNHASGHGPRENYKPINFAVMPDGGHGTLRVEYLHLPGAHHFFHVRASSYHPEGNRADRSFLVPTTPEEADEFGRKLQEIDGDNIQQKEGEAISRAVRTEPTQRLHYHGDLQDAGLGHLVPAEAPEAVARHSKSVSEALRFSH